MIIISRYVIEKCQTPYLKTIIISIFWEANIGCQSGFNQWAFYLTIRFNRVAIVVWISVNHYLHHNQGYEMQKE